MSKQPEEYLKHILDEIEYLLNSSKDTGEEKFMAGMRDKLIHHYFGVDYTIVWDVVKNEIPMG
ncbi:MAG: HepT-like ribonuclease domain-containing protein [Patescibacteria group bacterium]